MSKIISDYKCPDCKSEMIIEEFYEFNNHKCTKCKYEGNVKVRTLGFETPFLKISRKSKLTFDFQY